MFWGSKAGKSSSLPNLIYEWWDIDKICLYVKDPQERKHECLKSRQKENGRKHL